MVLTLKVSSSLYFADVDLYHMQGHIHLNQFRNRIKNNRSGGEDDLTLAIEHFRVPTYDYESKLLERFVISSRSMGYVVRPGTNLYTRIRKRFSVGRRPHRERS